MTLEFSSNLYNKVKNIIAYVHFVSLTETDEY
jgi:hypothetical protein